jgi:hypothetical protein
MFRSLHQLRMRITIAISGGLALLLLAPAARADRRTLIRAYEYATQPKGNLEFELWNDIDAPAAGFEAAAITHRVELEYGITDHWDMALYHVFESAPGASFHFDSWRLETRYRLAEKGEWPVDVMLYFEVERPAVFADPWETEQKLILAKDVGPWGFVANLVAEQKLLHARDKHLYEIDLGARYELTPALRVGAEAWTIQTTMQGATRGTWFLGPSVSVATAKVWIQLGVGFGLGIGDKDSLAEVRSVLGFNL